MVETGTRRAERRPLPNVEPTGSNGTPAGQAQPESATRHHGFVPPPGPIALIAAALVVVVLGLLYMHEQTFYVGTDNAVVTGAVAQLGSPTNGQIRSLVVDLGDEVKRGQVVASVALASPQNQPQAPVTHAQVRASIDGVIVARHVSQGDTVTAGRPIVSIVDPVELWVQANVDEGYVGRVRAGNPVDVTLPSLGVVLKGHVVAVGPASTAATNQLLQGTSGAGLQRSSPAVPVRIEVDPGSALPVLGSTASVRIRVQ